MIPRTAVIVFVALLAAPLSSIDAPTASLQVTARVGRSCLIDSGPLSFGDYDPVGRNAAVPLDGESILTVNCTRGTPSAVTLDAGQHAIGGSRFMAALTDRLAYDLYQDPSHTIPWGNTPAQVVLLGPSDGNPVSIRVYGRVLANQDVRAGTYGDSIVATVVF